MKRRLNRLSIEVGVCEQDKKRNPQPMSPSERGFWTKVLVDGRSIEQGLATDIAELGRSITRNIDKRTSRILCCGCGEPSCAGIWEGVRVHHHGQHVIWSFESPIRAGFSRASIRHWRSLSRKRYLRFSRSELMSVFSKAISNLLDLGWQPTKQGSFIGANWLMDLLQEGELLWLAQRLPHLAAFTRINKA